MYMSVYMYIHVHVHVYVFAASSNVRAVQGPVSFCPTIVLLLVCAMAAVSGEGQPEGERLAQSPGSSGRPGEGLNGEDINRNITGGVDGPKGCASGGSIDPVLPEPPQQAIVPHGCAFNQEPATVSNEEPQMQQHGLRKRGAEEVLKSVDDFCRAELKVLKSTKTTDDMQRVASERLAVLQSFKAKGRELQAKMSDAPATEQAVQDKDKQWKNHGPANKERPSEGLSVMSDQ